MNIDRYTAASRRALFQGLELLEKLRLKRESQAVDVIENDSEHPVPRNSATPEHVDTMQIENLSDESRNSGKVGESDEGIG
jgi:hypothetical protein